MNFEAKERLKFWTEKTRMRGEETSLRLLLEKVPEFIGVPVYERKLELRLGSKDDTLFTNLGTVWRLLRPFWCTHTQASLNEEVTERVRLSPGKDEDLRNLNLIHKLILPHREKSEAVMSKPNDSSEKPCSCLDLASGGGEHSCDKRSSICVRI